MAPKEILLQYRLTSSLHEISQLASEVQHALVRHKHLIFPVNFCLEELITNIITHGLKAEPNRSIDVQISMDDQCIEVEIRDDAPAFDPFTQAPEPDLAHGLEDRRIGGLGVYLTKKMMPQYQWCRQGDHNVIRLRRPLLRTT
jgi:serine/threonine-protein kinase RsbW/sigma-B regulation protein RsbU (phosphoserine phosphatase)